ncbi:MAG TPA: hypothetical protein VF712_00600 [Thermoleophilaceae bacterium]|jgi:hypothetical protein
MLLLTLTAAIAAAGCGDDTPDLVPLSQAEACRAVKERLDAEELETRFGEPDSTQDFFGDQVLAYEDEAEDLRWQFQVSQQAGTFRALRVKGSREEIVDCPR